MNRHIIKLKKATMRDLSLSWIGWLNDKEVNKFSKKKYEIHTYNSQKNYLKETLADKTKLLFMLIHNKKKIGTLLISKISKINRNCEISYLLGERNLWNKGIGTKFINLGVRYIFKQMNFKKIYAGVRSDNISSQKILKKNNFKLEAKLKSHFFVNKRYLDYYIFSLTK